jgi:hypothetical protein
MHPDLSQYAAEYAEKQRAVTDAWQRLEVSSQVLLSADPSAPSYKSISATHAQLCDEWVSASCMLLGAIKGVTEKAAELAKLPSEHRLRQRKVS